MFQDEYEDMLSRRNKLQKTLEAEYKRKGEACEQSPDSRHDNFDFEDADRTIRMLAPRVASMDSILKRSKILLLTILKTSEKIHI
jgi:hypothetical protein